MPLRVTAKIFRLGVPAILTALAVLTLVTLPPAPSASSHADSPHHCESE